MKKRREGTLKQIEADAEGRDFEKAVREIRQLSICGLDDFIEKARELAQEMSDCPDSLRAERAESLRRDLDRIEASMHQGIDDALYTAIGAALTYANLRHEGIDDSMSRGKISRQKFFRLKGSGLIDKQIAAELGVTASKLSEWKKRHLRD